MQHYVRRETKDHDDCAALCNRADAARRVRSKWVLCDYAAVYPRARAVRRSVLVPRPHRPLRKEDGLRMLQGMPGQRQGVNLYRLNF